VHAPTRVRSDSPNRSSASPPIPEQNAKAALREPRELVSELEASRKLPRGLEERFAGYGVMGLPFRSGHLLAPTLVWLIADTSATLDGVDLGDIGPAPTPGELGEFRIPQRGIFAIGRALFDPRPSRQQEDQVTIRPRRPNESENHGARRREMVRAEGLPQAPDREPTSSAKPCTSPVGTCRRRRLHPRADREGGTGARPRRVPADHFVEATSMSCRSTTRCLTP
jgi:hypothetical protein